uniref:Uncharacterized protein n=1 Tax=Spermophilus dauricus TaxID=99837 RepID=A0A8C9PM06_SPEDA
MGSAKSIPVSPPRAPPHNKHRARGADSRPPSAGIPDTPTQVESSPQSTLPAGEQLKGPKQAQDSDPHSPCEDPQSPLVKELSEVSETEASKSNLPPESILPLGVPSSFELGLPLDTQLSLEDQPPPWNDTEHPSKQVSSQEDARYPTETPVGTITSPKKIYKWPTSTGKYNQ